MSSSKLRLPTELVEQIIIVTWGSSLSTADRITFMTSSLLVTHAWKVLFLRIASTDVHIPCQSYLDYYFRALSGYSALLEEKDRFLPKSQCRAITIKISAPDITATSSETGGPPTGRTLSTLLYCLHGIFNTPNLRTLRVEYENVGSDDLFMAWRFIHFPSQIVNLEIISSSDDEVAPTHNSTRSIRHEPNFIQFMLPPVKALTVLGASDHFAQDLKACCPNVLSVSLHA